mmetsp:Transcript_29321/g.94525  ORF Transcript_29321/g.94525 Transcript_29321/m.94525 type:complete len:201 (-) Transcript_29321:3132-3734(-)
MRSPAAPSCPSSSRARLSTCRAAPSRAKPPRHSTCRSPTPSLCASASTARWAPRRCSPSCRPLRGAPSASCTRTPTRACPTPWAATTTRRRCSPTPYASSPSSVWSTCWGDAAAPRPSTSPHWRRCSTRRSSSRTCATRRATRCGCRAWRPSRATRTSASSTSASGATSPARPSSRSSSWTVNTTRASRSRWRRPSRARR